MALKCYYQCFGFCDTIVLVLKATLFENKRKLGGGKQSKGKTIILHSLKIHKNKVLYEKCHHQRIS